MTSLIAHVAPTPPIKDSMNAVRDEPAQRRIDVAVAIAGLLKGKEPVGDDEVQDVFCSSHRYVEQTPLFLDLLRGPGRHVGRDAPIDYV